MKISKTIAITFLTMLPTIARAQDLQYSQDQLKKLDMSVAYQATPDAALQVAAESFLDKIPYILTVLAFASLLYSGGMYVLAFGDANKMEQAKKNLLWTVYGMIAVTMVLLGIKVVVEIAKQTTRFPAMPNL